MLTIETRSTEAAPPPRLEEVRCRQCRRLLSKITPRALRENATLELKCGSCNTMNFIVGRPEEE